MNVRKSHLLTAFLVWNRGIIRGRCYHTTWFCRLTLLDTLARYCESSRGNCLEDSTLSFIVGETVPCAHFGNSGPNCIGGTVGWWVL